MKKSFYTVTTLALWCLAGLTGCAMLDPGPPMAQVILPVRHTSATHGDRMPARILVSQPFTDSAIGTDRILALKDGYEVFALSSARWVSSVPRMVQNLIIDELEAQRRFDSVGWEESIFNANVRLQTDIRRFYLTYDLSGGLPTAEIALVFTILDSQSGDTFARLIVTEKQPCAENSLKAFVAAYSTAMTKALAQCGAWVVDTLHARLDATPPAR